MTLCKSSIHNSAQFSHLTEIKNTGLHQLCILRKALIGIALTIVHQLFGITIQLLNIYAHTREECEEKLAALIVQMKRELAELKAAQAAGTTSRH